jgi:Zn-dependent metalloprotease
MKRKSLSSLVMLLVALAPLASAADSNKAVAAAAARLKADTGNTARISINAATGTARFVRLAPSSSTQAKATPAAATGEQAAAAFFRDYGGLFGVRNAASELSLVRSFSDKLGAQHVVYSQVYNSVPVFGAEVRVHSRGGSVNAASGVFVPDLALQTTPAKAWDKAAAIAVAKVRTDKAGAALAARSHRLVVFREGLLRGRPGANRLAWEVEVGDGKAVREFVYMDANTGKFIDQISGVADDLNRRAYDGANLPTVPPSYPASPFWVEGDAFPTGTLEADNMIVSSEETYNFFLKAFGRDSIDGNGAVMDMIFNRGYQCPNASWNGTFISFCPGFTTDDITSHEWGHAYTQFTNNLIYQWQSGALNESYSDIWGETIDQMNGRGLDEPGGQRSDGSCSSFTPFPPSLRVNSPASIAGDYQAVGASFGAPLTGTGVTGDVVRVNDGAGAAVNDGCESPFVNAAAVAGKIAFIDRGTCDFITKVRNAQLNGAVAAIVGDVATSIPTGGMSGVDPTVTIPSLNVQFPAAQAVRGELGGTLNATLRLAVPVGLEDSYRWLIGEEVPGGAGRDMWNPTCNANPGKVTDSEYWCSAGDQGGVHENSGVPNHLYALLVDGGHYNGQTINGLGVTKAAHILFRNQSTYLGPASDFSDHADGLEQSCADLVGQDLTDLATGAPSGQVLNAADCNQVTKAIAAVELRTPPAQCGFEPLLGDDPPPFCPTGNAPINLLRERFNTGGTRWVTDHTAVTPADFTDRDWQVVSSLPDHRAGSAMFAPNPNIGTCLPGGDESGVLHLTSPAIKLPNGVSAPLVSFDHWVSTEIGFDGGNLKLSVNGGAWQVVPSGSFTYSPYNVLLAGPGNSNPMAGEEAWSGADEGSNKGSWGTSRVDLTGLAAPGDSIRLRYDLGNDCGTGALGWYVTDVRAYACASTAAPQVSIDDVEVAEGNRGTRKARFTISLGAISDKPVTVTYDTADGTARVANNDYAPKSGSVVIQPGQIAAEVAATVVGDRITERDERFSVRLLHTTRGTILDNRGICTIVNDDN